MDCRVKPGNDEAYLVRQVMTASWISLALVALIAIAVWEGFS
jgi:hypothetical protein